MPSSNDAPRERSGDWPLVRTVGASVAAGLAAGLTFALGIAFVAWISGVVGGASSKGYALATTTFLFLALLAVPVATVICAAALLVVGLLERRGFDSRCPRLTLLMMCSVSISLAIAGIVFAREFWWMLVAAAIPSQVVAAQVMSSLRKPSPSQS